MEARVAFFDDDDELTPAGDDSDLLMTAQNLLKDLSGDGYLPEAADPSILSVPASLSFFIASLEGFTHAERQQILEMTSSRDRLQKCVEALSKILKRFRLTNKIEKIIGGNGHPPGSILKQLADKLDS